MHVGIKKSIIYVSVAVLIFLAGYYAGSREGVLGDGESAERVTDDLHHAQDSIDGATDSIDRAGNANQDAQDTAHDIEHGNQQLQNSAGTSSEAIDRFGAILEEIRNQPAKD